MMTKNIIVVAAMFMFALTVGILTANLAESGNDRASAPTIHTLVLQYYKEPSAANGSQGPASGRTRAGFSLCDSDRYRFCGIMFIAVGPMAVVWMTTSPSFAQTKWGVFGGSE